MMGQLQQLYCVLSKTLILLDVDSGALDSNKIENLGGVNILINDLSRRGCHGDGVACHFSDQVLLFFCLKRNIYLCLRR